MLKNILIKILPASLRKLLSETLIFLEQFVDYAYFLVGKLTGLHSNDPAFVIFGQGRTGSTLLTSLIDSHPGILCEGEIINNRQRYWYGKIFFLNAFVLGRRLRHRHMCYGFKFKNHHFATYPNHSSNAFLTLLQKKGWKVIYLKRNNFFYHALSQLVAEHNGRQYHHKKHQGKLLREKVHVDIEKLRFKMDQSLDNQIKATEQFLKGIDCFEIIYEDNLEISANQQDSMNELFEYIGISSHQVSTDHVKINQRPLEDIISNVEEVKEYILSSQYAQYLNRGYHQSTPMIKLNTAKR